VSDLWRCGFEVLGEPVGKPAARAMVVQRGSQYVAILREADREHPIHRWSGCIRSAGLPHRLDEPFAGAPLEAHLTFLVPPPQYLIRRGRLLRTWPIVKPDIDNYCKGLLDALTSVGFWEDDSLIVRAALEKRYAAPGQLPRCQVRIEELLDPLAPRDVGQLAMEITG